MTQLLPFFIILIAGLFFSEIFKRFHLPWVSALIIAGVITGPHGLGLFTPNETMTFLADIGLIFLMFLAGLETRLSTFRTYRRDIAIIVLVSSLLPFGIGFGIGAVFFGVSLQALLLGIIFVASSIAVIIPSLESCKLIATRFGQVSIGATIVMDVVSLLAISLLLQGSAMPLDLPLPLFYIGVIAAVIVLRIAVLNIWRLIDSHVPDGDDPHQEEWQGLFAILIGTVILFEFVGLHPVVAGFFAGFVLSESLQSKRLLEKVRSFGYGLFVPVFFVILGAETDVLGFLQDPERWFFVLAIVVTAMASKFLSGLLAGRIIGFSRPQRLLLGTAMMPHLTTTLAAALIGADLGIFSPDIVSAIIILIIITSFISPLLIMRVSMSRHREKIM